jgi:hypothetical protein
MAHPFYGDYKQPNFNVHKVLSDQILQSARIMSNERIVRKQQKGAKERLSMEIDSREKMFNRTENRLDTALADTMRNNAVNRKILLNNDKRSNELHPHDLRRKELTNKKLELLNEYEEHIIQDKKNLWDMDTQDKKDLYNERMVDRRMDEFINAFEFNPYDVFQKGPQGDVLLDDNGLPIVHEDAAENFRGANEDQLMDAYDTFISENDQYSNVISFNDFKEKFVSKEDEWVTRGNAEIDRMINNLMIRHDLSESEVMPWLTANYKNEDGSAPEWLEQFEVNLRNSDTGPKYGLAKEGDEYDYYNNEDFIKIDAALNDTAQKFDSGDLKWNAHTIRNIFKSDSASNKILKDIHSALDATDEELDEMTFSATTLSDGTPVVTFTESDASGDDYWIGRLTSDGKVMWQDATGVKRNYWGESDNETYTTEQMLDNTEGIFGFGNWSGVDASTLNYFSPK